VVAVAATGGRPRDIVNLLEHVSLHSKSSVATASQRTLLNALLAEAPWSGLFVQFLLPSLLSVTFCAFSDNRVSVFGEAAPKAVLLNADMLAIASDRIDGIPVLSLRFSRSIPDGLPDLSLIVESLVAATTFCSLDGSGKDFERVWVGLMMLHLLLQHAVRATVRVAATESRRVFDPEGAEPERFVQLAVAPSPNKLVEPNNVFWPLDDKLGQRDFPLPSTELAIDVFAESHSTARRIDALFPCPDANRVHVAAGASIHHKVSLREQPSLAVWHDLWSPTVEPGTLDALPVGWPGAAVVQWKPGTVVYLSKSNNEAVDSLLLVGDAGGSGDDEPHVVLFQFNAHGVITHGTKTATAAHVEPSTVHGIVKKVWRCLDRLLSSEFSATHVLRRAGIVRMTQVTLCIAAWDVEPTTINLNAPDNAVDAPFNVVLMDAADLIALGGLSFSSTLFFRNLKLRQ
jgi:hypothetical protein